MSTKFSLSFLILSTSMIACSDHANVNQSITSKIYDTLDLENLIPYVREACKGIKNAFDKARWIGMKGVQVAGKALFYDPAELEVIPLFECLKSHDDTVIEEWIKKRQQSLDAHTILSVVDVHTEVATLINSQNNEWQQKNSGKQLKEEKLSVDEALTRIFQTAHLKAKSIKVTDNR